jgi:hypothetical protein
VVLRWVRVVLGRYLGGSGWYLGGSGWYLGGI